MNAGPEAVAAWLRLAMEDLRAARLLLRATPPALTAACFHAQQCVEKALKAMLTFHGIEPPKTHDLRRLFQLCVQRDPTIDPLREADWLTQFAVATRYPGEPQPPQRHALEAVELADKVLAHVFDRLPPGTHP